MEQPTRSFSPEKILDLWEAGRRQHELDRALTLLNAAFPELSRDQLAELTIGERDARLLRVRTLLLGAGAGGISECPDCGERVEFPVDTTMLARPEETSEPPREFEVNGTRVRFRLPTSRDLAEVVAAPNAGEALRRLIEQCVIEPCTPEELPDEMIGAISQAILKADPQAEIVILLCCPNCGRRWELLFDIAHFFWNEIAAQAQRLVYEIDALARAYGWTEHEILSLPTQRRQTYLEILAA